MAKLAYKDMLKDDEVKLFIRTYCTFHDGWRLERGKPPYFPDSFQTKDSCWWLITRDYGCIASLDLKTILKDILKIDRRVFHTWKSPAEMRIWFDLNKVNKV